MNTQYDRRWCRLCVFSICAWALGGCNEESGTTDGESRAPARALTTSSVLGPESSPGPRTEHLGPERGKGSFTVLYLYCTAMVKQTFH